MTTRQTLTVGENRFRVGPWHADAQIAYLALPPEGARPTASGLRGCLDRIAASGYSSVITSALHPDEAEAFLRLGFTEYDRLRVLAHDLSDLDPPRPPLPPAVRLRRVRRSDRGRALAVDARAFPTFWRLDAAGLAEAESATPATRFRVAEWAGTVVGYAVTGRGGSQGFLQRLAADPDRAGHGIGSALVLDAMRWSRRRRCRCLLVNTQHDNRRALELYTRLGFRPTPTDLVVLARPIP